MIVSNKVRFTAPGWQGSGPRAGEAYLSRMKITTWNCARGFAKKAPHIFLDRPDIAVIQECSEKSTKTLPFDGYKAEWAGVNPRIGMGVFYNKDWGVRRLDVPATGIEWVVPYEVTGPENFTLIAVWACEVKGNQCKSYVGQIGRALHEHPEWFTKVPVVMMGDFNSNARFDKERRHWNHSNMVEELRNHGLESAYHSIEKKEHGKDETPTFHLQKNSAKPFHLDYIFAPQVWQSRMSITVGSYTTWKPYSDHCPVTLQVSANA